jgi:hypothetical protein
MDTRFEKKAIFRDSQFNGDADFSRAEFNSSADFDGAQFNSSAIFWGTSFKGAQADFKRSSFYGLARFWSTRFDVEMADFGWSQFGGDASFWDAKFGGDAAFKGSRFKGTADFMLAQFNRSVDFMGTRFEKELFFNDVRFISLKISWEFMRDRLICNGQTYLGLIKNFKDMEQFEDADGCYYQYRDWKRKDRDIGWPKFFDYLAWLSCGYGVRWQHTILSGILVMLLFGIYFEYSNIAKSISDLLTQRDARDVRIRNTVKSIKKSLSFSAMILLSLPSDWFPYGKDEYSSSVKSHLYSAILERLIGWGLMLLLIGTLTRLMVRY